MKRGGAGGTGLDLATLLPAAIPGTLMGVAVLAFSQGLWLTGTGIIIVIGMAAVPAGRLPRARLPWTSCASLDESAANLGALG